MKPLEQFDFSKVEEQRKFEKLPKKKQEKFIESQTEEGYVINDLVSSGVASNFEQADAILNEYKKSPDFSFESLSDSLEKVKAIKDELEEKIKEVSEDREMVGYYGEYGNVNNEQAKELAEKLTLRIIEQRSNLSRDKINQLTEFKPSFGGTIVFRKVGEEWASEKGKWDDEKDEYVLGKESEEALKLSEEALNVYKGIKDDKDKLLNLVLAGQLGIIPEDSFKNLYEGSGFEENEKLKSKLSTLGLEEFLADGRYSDGDKYLGYKDDIWSEARKHIIEQYQNMLTPDERRDRTIKGITERYKTAFNVERLKLLSNAQAKLEKSTREKERLEVKSQGYSKLKKSNQPIDLIEKNIPWAIKLVGKENPAFIEVLPQDGVVAMLKNESHYYGSGGSEYGVRATVFRNNPNNKDSKYFKWRDPYDERNDNGIIRFDKLEILKVDMDSVSVKLINSSDKFEREMTFNVKEIEKSAPIEMLSEEEQANWIKNYEDAKRKAVEDSFLSNAQMPNYIRYEFSARAPEGADMNMLVPYDHPRLVDEYVDEENGVAAIIIKSQIDHKSGRGKQFKWEGFVVDKSGKMESVWLDNAYELALRQGKKIEMKASDLIRLRKK